MTLDKKNVTSVCLMFLSAPALASAALSPLEELGKALFLDAALSSPSNQSCAACHEGRSGFTGPIPGINKAGSVYPGAVRQRFGNRRPPTAAYAGESPMFHYDAVEGLFVGGMFWDGRATGWVTGDPLADQAMGPFLNPVEQNLPDEETACMIVAGSRYAPLYEQSFGSPIDCYSSFGDGHLKAYVNFALAVAAYERSVEVTPYDSKYDYVLAGEAMFTMEEQLGKDLFEGKAKCALCHPGPEFTDFTYDNLGVPKNPDNPFYRMDRVYVDGVPINPDGVDFIDPGLSGFLVTLPTTWFALQGLDKDTAVLENYGKHKVPTLRNADKRPGPGFAKSYMHNGSLKSLEEVVRFYNRRNELITNGLLEPEVWENMNEAELGNLGLTEMEEAYLVAFLRTLTDGYTPRKDKKKK